MSGGRVITAQLSKDKAIDHNEIPEESKSN
mgnify:CR=1 FL=1